MRQRYVLIQIKIKITTRFQRIWNDPVNLYDSSSPTNKSPKPKDLYNIFMKAKDLRRRTKKLHDCLDKGDDFKTRIKLVDLEVSIINFIGAICDAQ